MSSFSGRNLPFHQLVLYRSGEGQILLVVVLLMVVILTIGLSVATRNISNFRQSTEEDQSQRAFSAAEAGIQIALEQKGAVSTISKNFTDTTKYKTELIASPTQEVSANGGGTLLPNETMDIWLAGYPSLSPESQWSGRINLYWGESQTYCNNAALEITILSGAKNSPILTQYTYDPCQARSTENRFTWVGPNAIQRGTKVYQHQVLLPEITSGLLMRIVPLYRGTPLVVAPGAGFTALPVQQRVYESTGTSGETSRKIVVSQSFPKLPLELFPYVLFTPSN